MTTSDIEGAARQVAVAAAASQKASAALAKAEAHRQRITDRITAKDAERAAIVSRRVRGKHDPDDAGALALIEADREGLSQMLVAADTDVAAAHGPAEQARQQHAAAQFTLQRAEDEAEEEALVAHAAHLDALLLATVGQLADIAARTGRPRPAWAPSTELATALRRVMAVKGML